MRRLIGPGRSFPLGATVHPDGVNFCVFAKDCAALELLLFERADDAAPAHVIALDPQRNRTFHYWHAFAPGLKAGQLYGYRARGQPEPRPGPRRDADKVLLDPYGRAVSVGGNYSRLAASRPGDNAACALKSVVADLRRYDWEGDAPLRRPFARTVIYEMHVGGFTRHPNSGVAPEKRGTYAGLIEKIPYLQDLGVTAVELLPVFQFDAQDAPAGLANYWGYSPVSFFAPHSGYSSAPGPLGVLDEFRDMVKALHRAGIEVLLDVVYNHTAEGGAAGPTLCFKGLGPSVYYILEEDQAGYADYSGTGNTLNANQAVVRRLILDSLRAWVSEMHVDGFRFDLASILSRDETGRPLPTPPVLWDIESDPVLAGTKLIAEAWDAAGLYQVGSFGGERWKEWNGQFRDDVRSLLRGDPGQVPKLAERLLASPDLYARHGQDPERSVNFVTCHDGFTLNDLVSYDRKHNEANREGNRDGTDGDLSWNCGMEGPSSEPAIERLRERQVKNFLTLTLSALGTPMLSMGDEVRRTQFGNNNAYCQDNELGWFDWSLVEKHEGLRRFVKGLIRFRLGFYSPRSDRELSLTQFLAKARIQWHGVEPGSPDWGNDSHSLAASALNREGTQVTYLIINAYWEPLGFNLPPAPDGSTVAWKRLIDTSLPSPDDIQAGAEAPRIAGAEYLAQPRSVVLLGGEVRPVSGPKGPG
ncbi:MAG: glycogen debranching protein GlgX [Elusimicrobia bacterium]|nr:glycogen debranching protein GlgX [Elusimicrobiota bacterium]